MKSVAELVYAIRVVTLITISILVLSATCSKQKIAEIRLESSHFTVIGSSPQSSMEEAQAVLQHAESMRLRFSDLLGNRFDPQQKIFILLEGPFIEQGPYFDQEGVHLFRYSQEENGYLALLTHELGHAFREPYYIEYEPWKWPQFAYYDEAFAEYLAQLVESAKTGFPFYGHPEDIVAGSMVVDGTGIPQDTLRENNDFVNESCNIQAYALRASWCRFVHERYGWGTLLDLVYGAEEPTREMASLTLGENLSKVDSLWSSWLQDRFNQYENASVLASRFREHTSWFVYCQY